MGKSFVLIKLTINGGVRGTLFIILGLFLLSSMSLSKPLTALSLNFHS